MLGREGGCRWERFRMCSGATPDKEYGGTQVANGRMGEMEECCEVRWRVQRHGEREACTAPVDRASQKAPPLLGGATGPLLNTTLLQTPVLSCLSRIAALVVQHGEPQQTERAMGVRS